MTETFESAEIDTLLRTLADASGDVGLRHFRAAVAVADKSGAGHGFDPVTEADRGVEAAIRAVLADRRPDDAILGEELDDVAGSSGYRWVVDPIDGTMAFISGLPIWGTIIGLERAGRPIAGLFHQPFTGERYWSSDGTARHAGRNGAGTVIRTSGVTALAEATLMTTSPRMFNRADGARYDRVEAHVRLTCYGFHGYAYCMLAAGHVDLVVEADLKPYDICGLVPVIEAAGGVVTDWEGGPAHGGGRAVAAATPDLHAAALALIGRSD